MTAVGDARKRQQAHGATETAPGDAQGSDRGADVVGRLSEAERAMSDTEGDAWDALHDDADIICTCGGCNYYSPTYDPDRECSLTTHIKAISAAIVHTHTERAWDEGANAAVEPVNTGTRMTLRAVLPFPTNPYAAAREEQS